MSDLALLDVNVLIALLDDAHTAHAMAKDFLVNHILSGGRWASCSITQNGCLRIMSSPSYPNDFDLIDIKNTLQSATDTPWHVFLSDDVSLLMVAMDWQKVQGNKQLTDLHLMALANRHNATFVSFDKRLSTMALTCHLIILHAPYPQTNTP